MEAREREAALERARRGDADALGRLLESYRPYLRVLVRPFHEGRLQARLDDSDLIQDALLQAHRGFASFAGTTAAEFTGWLRQIVLRTAGQRVRAHSGAVLRDVAREQSGAALADLPADGETPAARAVRHEEAARVAEALARLPDDMQQVLLLRLMDGLPYAVVAERLGRSEGAARVLFTRAVRRLRQEVHADERS
jgi:RNA polymerase sigma-70 factor (ECF subfamily)